ncbi:aquaporin NIP1-1-like isoform X1 [Diospyros lotus]|uniref:aquaporin NIP1-1-like isoform X1 n=1 Tax=Diospyros lotus TaxID=55363 RepID=UPI00224F0B05|nr:aquaporin NIP1-1-like isoform X1 [Diospyros lotus]
MAENSEANGSQGSVALNVGDMDPNVDSGCFVSVPFAQKLIAEVVGTYFLIFAGCGAAVVNSDEKGAIITFPGVAIVFGLVVMVMVYSVGHVSGAHFNPAVTIAFATCKRFPWKQAPAYISAQLLGSTLASGTLRLIFQGKQDHFAGTLPSGSNIQSFVLEFVITFCLMFVISGVATDNRAIGELAGLVVGATVLLNVMFAGPISGASMNPVRSLGPAIASNKYKGIWIYIVAPITGAIAGAWVYNIIRFTDKPLRETTKTRSFFKRLGRSDSKHPNYVA